MNLLLFSKGYKAILAGGIKIYTDLVMNRVKKNISGKIGAFEG